MAPKIFNRALALLAGIVLSTTVFAQVTPPLPPTPPVQDEDIHVDFDTKAFEKSMAHVQLKMKDLQVRMKKLTIKQKADIKLVMKDFSKTFSSDFGKNFAGAFDGLVPDVSESFNGSVKNNTDNEEYRKKIASGEITEKIKNYSKSYSVDGNDLLELDNRFGKITVNTWAKNEFKVDVQMKFSSENADYVNNMIQGASVSDSKVGSTVSFKTNLPSSNNNGNRHQSMEINYTVYMPAGNPVDIENKFGSVVLPDLSGKATIRVSYGGLTAGALTNSENDVTVKFGDANIGNFNSGKVEVAYGKLKTGTVNNIEADIKFSSINIDRLKGSADVTVKYGDGFRIGTVEKTVKSIYVNAQFTKINFDFRQLGNYTFDVTTRFGGFDYDDNNMKVTSKTPSDEDRGWSSTKNYKGYIGNSGSANKISITASYTGVSFY
ncbi:hypothetical protein A0256_04205 [Mucilaginibacter sp. PAMC 26640]|nr:hypothetical protein A0256_04205 [Mucilaginibacter sp. PAMC 26640]